MPADTPGKPRASPRAGAPAGASRTPDQPRSVTEHRKSSKPVMEKRRRARINESLAQLQSLLLDALRKESSRRSKLEKADILELTVRHLQSLRRVQVTAALRSDPAILGKYRAGFHECLAEVNRFLAGCEGVPADVRSRLLGHLAACLARLGPARRPLPLAPATEAQEPEIYAGRPPPPAFDGRCPLPRPGAALAPIFLPRMENFQYSVQLSDQDWAEFSAATEECGLLQAGLASGDEPLSSDTDQRDSSGSSPPGPSPFLEGQLAPGGSSWPSFEEEDKAAIRQLVSRSWHEPMLAPEACQQTPSTSARSEARLSLSPGATPLIQGSSLPGPVSSRDEMQRLLQGPAPRGPAPAPTGEPAGSPESPGHSAAPQRSPGSPGAPPRSPGRKKRRTAGTKAGGRSGGPGPAPTQLGSPLLTEAKPEDSLSPAGSRGKGLPAGAAKQTAGTGPESAGAPEQVARQQPEGHQQKPRGEPSIDAPGHHTGEPPLGPIQAPRKKKVRFSMAVPSSEEPWSGEVSGPPSLATAPRMASGGHRGSGAWDSVAVGPRSPQPRILKHLPPPAPSASMGPGPRSCFAVTLPEAYDFFFCDTIEEEDEEAEGAAEAAQAPAEVQWPDVCEFFFQDSQIQRSRHQEGRSQAPPLQAGPVPAPPPGDPMPISIPEAYEHFLEEDRSGGTLGPAALLQTQVTEPPRSVLWGVGTGAPPESSPATVEQLTLAIREAVAPRGPLTSFTFSQKDMCMVFVAFATWAVRTSDLHAPDAWKTVLLANIGTVSAIRYFRRQVERGRHSRSRSPSPSSSPSP
ncbi:hypothetical protein MG293_012995 [Ovis ammon polii]|uniref:Transcription factor HES-4 n=1 Tax=Ovis ammon polii TaxID=230172 RepID=A0AAD4TZ16_OVIAM|nr:hypothetical protein MG293_012995 [Ovis ammon polii]